jgi:hypothetical protein
MIVRYRMNSTCTLANMQTDIHNIISGNVSSTANLSSGCDTANSAIYGTYPTGIYTVQNAGTYTYSKVHNDYGAGTTHYFRLTFDSTRLTGLTLAQSYTSGTDTLVNSQSLSTEVITNFNSSYVTLGYIVVSGIYRSTSNIAAGQKVELASNTQFDLLNTPPGLRIISKPNAGATGSGTTGSYYLNKYVSVAGGGGYDYIIKSESTALNISPTTYSATDAPFGIDIVITNKCFFISAQGFGIHLGIFDIGKNGVTREWTNSMLMAGVDLSGGLQSLAKVPYSYKYSTLSYGTSNDLVVLRNNPVKQLKASGGIAILENPIFLQYPDAGNAIATTYGLYAIAPSAYAPNSVYTDGTTYRLVVNDFAILGA